MKKYGIINFLNFIQKRYFLVQNLSQITILNSFPRKNIYFSRKKYFLTPRKSKKELEIYKICLRPSPLNITSNNFKYSPPNYFGEKIHCPPPPPICTWKKFVALSIHQCKNVPLPLSPNTSAKKSLCLPLSTAQCMFR